jgi:elongation factor P
MDTEVRTVLSSRTSSWVVQLPKEEMVVTIVSHRGSPLNVVVPTFVELAVEKTDPGLRGDTASGGSKPATVETGAVIQVPLFINVGDRLRIDTRTGAYIERA